MLGTWLSLAVVENPLGARVPPLLGKLLVLWKAMA